MPIFRHHYFAHFEKGKEIQTGKMLGFFSEIVIHTPVRLNEKGFLFPAKMACGLNFPYLEVNGVQIFITTATANFF